MKEKKVMKMNLWKKTKNKFSLNKIVHNILSINIISTHIFFIKLYKRMKVFFCMCLQQPSHTKAVVKIIIATLESKRES